VAKLTKILWNIATEEGYSTTRLKLNRALWNITLILAPINILLSLIYLISPFSAFTFYIALLSFLPIFAVIGRGIYAQKNNRGYPLTWALIYCVNANIFLIVWFIYHIIVIQ